MRARVLIVIGLLLLGADARPRAWGMDVHRRLTARAIEGLPAPLRAFFMARREFVVEHSVDPDLWRIVELRGARGAEDPNHFLDIDGLDEPAPFTNVPREWAAYVARYGEERATRMGRLPWRIEELDAWLVRAFQSMRTSAYAADNARYLSAVLAHYLEDAHQPFHAVLNYDGQLTGQRGIHARFETDLVLRHWSRLRLAPVTIQPVPNVKDFVFAALADGTSKVPIVLAGDRKAIEGRTLYDDGYYDVLLRETRVVLQDRLSASASGVASAIVSAWTRAGRPALPADAARPPAPIRR
jgi:hypothetical protein